MSNVDSVPDSSSEPKDVAICADSAPDSPLGAIDVSACAEGGPVDVPLDQGQPPDVLLPADVDAMNPKWSCFKGNVGQKFNLPKVCAKHSDCLPLPELTAMCVGNQCWYGPLACTQDVDCDDASEFISASCKDVGGGVKHCIYWCSGIACDGCNDYKICTVDKCVEETVESCQGCAYKYGANCCTSDDQCSDGDPCSADWCFEYECQHKSGCCNP